MTQEETNKILAKALLELASKSTYSWEYGGENCTATGIHLDCEQELYNIIDGK